MIKELSSLAEFIEEKKEKKGEKITNYSYFYRGQTQDYPLKPSIYRCGNENILKNENNLINEIISKRPDLFDERGMLDVLVKLQHYGFPTRLLDITENPLVALYFACKKEKNEKCDDNKKKPILYEFKVKKSEINYTDSDKVIMLANLSKLDSKFDFELFDKCKSQNTGKANKEIKDNLHIFIVNEYIKRHNQKKDVELLEWIKISEFYNDELQKYFNEKLLIEIEKNEDLQKSKNDKDLKIKEISKIVKYMKINKKIKFKCSNEAINAYLNGESKDLQRFLHFIREDSASFKNKIKLDDIKYPIIAKPRKMIDRMQNQVGSFFMFGYEKDELKEDSEKKLQITKYEINNKEEILKELNALNINEASIMGDLDSIIKEFVEQHK